MTRPRCPSPETERLAAQAAAFAHGQAPEVLAWLGRLGCRIAHRRDEIGEWVLDGPSGIRTGLSRGLDAVTVAVQLGFLLAGPHWPFVFPRLMETADCLGRQRGARARGPHPHPPTTAADGNRARLRRRR